jgi:prophage antirepressor-like protein
MNNSNLSVFSFESRNVRYLIVDFEPWFCLSDVLIAINSATKPSEAEALIKSELGLNFCFSVTKDETKKQLKLKWDELTFINESALTFYVTQSRTELGKKLNQFVHVEVLPSIRKTGQYSVSQSRAQTGSYSVNQFREQLENQFLPERSLKEVKEYLELMESVYGEAYKQRLAPIVLKKFHPDLPVIEPAPSEKASLPVEALLTPTQIAEELGLFYSTGNPNPRKVNEMLEKLGYQTKVGGMWSATPKAKGLCDRKPVSTNSRSQRDQLMWSEQVVAILQEYVVK